MEGKRLLQIIHVENSLNLVARLCRVVRLHMSAGHLQVPSEIRVNQPCVIKDESNQACPQRLPVANNNSQTHQL